MAKTGRRKPVSPDGVVKNSSVRGRCGQAKAGRAASGKGRKTAMKGASTPVNKDDTATTAKVKDTGAKRRRPASDIPALDLGEQMLADQRKNASRKRVGPSRKTAVASASEETTPASPAARVRHPKPSVTELPEEPGIIADIVRRDIERLRGAR